MVFEKGRELDDPRGYMHLVKHIVYPAFGDYQTVRLELNDPEPDRQWMQEPELQGVYRV